MNTSNNTANTLIRYAFVGLFFATIAGCGQEPTVLNNASTQLAKAEAVIDAFYSFDRQALEQQLLTAQGSQPFLLYYQGWAEGGNYKIIHRDACRVADTPDVITCGITVEDDPMLALNTGFHVTDTFTLSFSQNKLIRVETSSNDPPIYYAARDWVLEHLPELVAAPCEGFFAGGPTPGKCAQAIAEGYRQFAQSEAYTAALPEPQTDN